ncbi:hypothetical protein L0E83_08855 [Marichromatium gracile]|uniref:hypothetical protein n=1 Tax=Marichromatium gracile TaxID=1048 RepID=UPI001F1F82B1|nr:hypothetical protein [Marichromatium gracile]MCF1183544.1 hypothetical protein [Marichromatium gracile]
MDAIGSLFQLAQSFMDWLLATGQEAFQWLADLFDWTGRSTVDEILSAVAALLEQIPMPDWYTNAGSYSMPSAAGWLLDLFEVQFGVNVVISAYTTRFMIRRIPGF